VGHLGDHEIEVLPERATIAVELAKKYRLHPRAALTVFASLALNSSPTPMIVVPIRLRTAADLAQNPSCEVLPTFAVRR
jgi:hypothetical protein